ncbi:MAG: hypothetical protein A2036_01435 [Omnitrophica bacterium GWA2_50_21]|nr:MAG: hypothetical protein A2036_01435 [Omnitrophica bacterium GWA2_50_21]
MRDIARRSVKDRSELFRATSQVMHVHEAIVEKDFWVCWILDYLFQDSPWKDRLIFKGGTSLSKAFGAIERFSEDIDLILDWQLLGYSEAEPWKERSATKQDAFGKEANRKASDFLSKDFVFTLRQDLTTRAGSTINVEAAGQDVFVRYPKAFSLEAILPQVRLEIGPLAAWAPNEEKPIRPYTAEHFQHLFKLPNTVVRTISAERTFWEKATILHQEAHRGMDKPMPLRYSRHYYDLYRLSLLPIGASALSKLNLLEEVARFKMRFYRCPWAMYEQAKPGSLRLLPPTRHLPHLQKDFRDMQAMLFGSIPSFDEIMSGLATLEKKINGY